MRVGMVMGMALLLAGCAHKLPQRYPPPNMEIPVKCITRVIPNVTYCSDMGNGEALCNGVVVKFACVKATKSK